MVFSTKLMTFNKMMSRLEIDTHIIKTYFFKVIDESKPIVLVVVRKSNKLSPVIFHYVSIVMHNECFEDFSILR